MTGNKNKAGTEDEFGTAEFDFSTMGDGFGDADDDRRDAGTADFGDFGDDPAGAPAFDDSGFGGDAATGPTEFADFGEGSYDDGGFEEMPSPGANPDTSAPGDPEDEFADVSSTIDPDEEPDTLGHGASDGFGPDESFTDDGFGPGRGDDVFADVGGSEAGDPFAEQPGTDASDATAAPAAEAAKGGSSGVTRLLFPVAAVALAGGLGYVGYQHFVAPTEIAPATAPVQALPPSDDLAPNVLPPSPAQPSDGSIAIAGLPDPAPSVGTGMPSLDAGDPAPASEASDPMAPSTELDDLTGGQRPGGIGSQAPTVSLPPLGGADAPASEALGTAPPTLDLPTVPGLPEVPAVTAPGTSVAQLPPAAEPTASEPAEEPASDLPGAAEIGRLEERLARLEARIEEMTRVLEGRDGAPTASAGRPEAVDTAATAVAISNVPPLKPILVDGATLKGVSRDLAWVSTGAGVVEVKVGDTVPGAGKVIRIRPYGGDWILVTEKGLVTR